jgi:hypothetical protein
MAGEWVRGSFRIVSSELSPTAIDEIVGLEPTSVVERPDGGSVWVLDSGLPPSRPVEDHVEALLRLVRPRGDELRKVRGTCEIFIGFAAEDGQGGMSFLAPVLDELAQLGIDLVLDLYPPERAEAEG